MKHILKKVYTWILEDSAQGLSVEVYHFSDGPWMLAHNNSVLDVANFRIRDDDDGEAAAAWLAALDTDITDWTDANLDTNFRLRFHIEDDNTGALNNLQPQLQFELDASGTWNDVNASSTSARSSASVNFGEDDDTTQQLTVLSNFITPNAGMDEVEGLAGEANEIDFVDGVTDRVEVEYCLQLRSADITVSTDIRFRLTQGVAGPTIATSSHNPLIQITFAGGDVDRTLSDIVTSNASDELVDALDVVVIKPRSEVDFVQPSAFPSDAVLQEIQAEQILTDVIQAGAFPSDARGVAVERPREAADTLSGFMTDNLDVVVEKPRAGVDFIQPSAFPTDAVFQEIQAEQIIADAVLFDESTQHERTSTSDTIEVVDVVDVEVSKAPIERLLSDNIELNESTQHDRTSTNDTIEVVDIGHASQLTTRELTDSIEVEDTRGVAVLRPREVVDSIELADVLDVMVEKPRAGVDNVTFNENRQTERTSTSDTIEITDSVDVRLPVLNRTMVDSITLNESTQYDRTSTSDTITFADEFSLQKIKPIQIADNIEVTDASTTVQELSRLTSNALTIADVLSAVVERPRVFSDAVIFNESIQHERTSTSDTIEVADVLDTVVEKIRFVSDSIPITDSQFRVLDRLRGESITLDAPDSTVIERFVLDSIDVVDTSDPVVVIGGDAFTDLLTLIDVGRPVITRTRGGFSAISEFADTFSFSTSNDIGISTATSLFGDVRITVPIVLDLWPILDIPLEQRSTTTELLVPEEEITSHTDSIIAAELIVPDEEVTIQLTDSESKLSGT